MSRTQKSPDNLQVRLESPALKVVNAFGKRHPIKSLSKTQLVNALIQEYEQTRKDIADHAPIRKA